MTPRQFLLPLADELVVDLFADGRPLSKAAQVRMCGNSVSPPLARALVAANYVEQHRTAANEPPRRKGRAA